MRRTTSLAMVACGLAVGTAEAQVVEGEVLPRIEGNSVTFFARARDGSPPTLVADFNGWGRYPQAEGVTAGGMEPVAGTPWYVASVELAPGARIEYGLLYGEGELVADPLNPKTTLTFGEVRSVVEMPGYQPSVHVGADGPLRGKLDRFTAEGGRAIHVYLPPGYPADAPYPTVYFNDGSFYLEEVQAHRIVESLIVGNALRPVLGVFVDPLDRRAEYRGDPGFLRFFTTSLLRRIDESYETVDGPGGRAVAGGSRGALGAAELAWSGEGEFGFVGMLAPAITPTDLLGRVADDPLRPLEIYLMGGTYDVRFIGDYHLALDAMRVKGYPVTAREAPIGHSPSSWKHFVPEMLTSFFPE